MNDSHTTAIGACKVTANEFSSRKVITTVPIHSACGPHYDVDLFKLTADQGKVSLQISGEVTVYFCTSRNQTTSVVVRRIQNDHLTPVSQSTLVRSFDKNFSYLKVNLQEVKRGVLRRYPCKYDSLKKDVPLPFVQEGVTYRADVSPLERAIHDFDIPERLVKAMATEPEILLVSCNIANDDLESLHLFVSSNVTMLGEIHAPKLVVSRCYSKSVACAKDDYVLGCNRLNMKVQNFGDNNTPYVIKCNVKQSMDLRVTRSHVMICDISQPTLVGPEVREEEEEVVGTEPTPKEDQSVNYNPRMSLRIASSKQSIVKAILDPDYPYNKNIREILYYTETCDDVELVTCPDC